MGVEEDVEEIVEGGVGGGESADEGGAWIDPERPAAHLLISFSEVARLPSLKRSFDSWTEEDSQMLLERE
jgi:hypothetical protein